jgi:hypothetical protein
VDEILFIVGFSHPNSLQKITHTLQYMVNVSYIAERQQRAPVVANSSLLLTADEGAQPSRRIRHRQSLNPDMEGIDNK